MTGVRNIGDDLDGSGEDGISRKLPGIGSVCSPFVYSPFVYSLSLIIDCGVGNLAASFAICSRVLCLTSLLSLSLAVLAILSAILSLACPACLVLSLAYSVYSVSSYSAILAIDLGISI